MVISSSASTALAGFALLLNVCSSSAQSHWYKLEGVLLVIMGSFWSWVVFRFTGVNGLVNGPSNSYFGVWGAFFYSISTFGVWLKEHLRLR